MPSEAEISFSTIADDVTRAAELLLKPSTSSSASKSAAGWVVSPSRSRTVLSYSHRVIRRETAGATCGVEVQALTGGGGGGSGGGPPGSGSSPTWPRQPLRPATVAAKSQVRMQRRDICPRVLRVSCPLKGANVFYKST